MSDAVSHLQRLEPLARRLEPGPEVRKALLDDVNAHAEYFLKDIDERPAYILTEDQGQAIVTASLQKLVA